MNILQKDITILSAGISAPEPYLDAHLDSIRESGIVQANGLFACRFVLKQAWLEGKPDIELWALYEYRLDAQDEKIRLLISNNVSHIEPLLAGEQIDIDELAEQLHTPVLALDDAIKLGTVSIAKPWGKEIWYTGVEKRGVSTATDGRWNVDLPWLIACVPERLFNNQMEIVLLKVLDPLPDEVYGDLYFELHEKKQEVYVVTHVDKTAWPDGVGGIRFGFCPEKKQAFSCSDEFLLAYRKAVDAYRRVRVEIDSIVDRKRLADGIELNAPVSAEQLKKWLQDLSPQLIEKEGQLRSVMDSYTNLVPLKLGDVVRIPCFVPHSLLHGVRTIEFQTPVYERKILSFGQKVLTQASWDTEDAMRLIKTDNPELQPFEIIMQSEQLLVEKIVDFDDFEVLRIRLSPGAVYTHISTAKYALAIGVMGHCTVGALTLKEEEACLIPADTKSNISLSAGSTGLILLSLPK